MKRGKLILAIGLVYITWFLYMIINKYGWDHLPSISKSAKYLTEDGNIGYFFMFITILCFTMGYVGNSSLTAFGGGVLWIIATMTGYNEALEIKGLQDTFHVICTLIGIVAILAEILRRGIKWAKGKKHLLWIFTFLLLFIIGYGISHLWAMNIKNHTFLIEALIIYASSLFFFVTPLNKGEEKTKTVQKAIDVTKKTALKTKAFIKEYPKNAKSKTPTWARICRNAGIMLTAASGALAASPVTVPAGLIGWLAFGGTLSTLIFQGFKKAE